MVISFISRRRRHVRGTKVEVGDILYAVRKGDLYWIWAYSDKGMAAHMDNRLTGPISLVDEAANWRRTVGELTPTDIRP